MPRFRYAFTVLLALAAAASGAPAVARELPDFTRLVQQHSPAVVNISAIQRTKPASTEVAPLASPPDEGLPGDSLRHPYGDPESEDSEGPSLGSGLVISEDGYILTCAHVVEEAREIQVRLNDRREYNARLVGADRRSDVALLKIEARGLQPARLGNPADLKVGEWVLAIGSPFGFASSATAGIVSAKSRNLPQENYIPFIQTDVAINPGNSGGPLFNLKGEVVGVNSQIYSRTGGFMGLSFAIPIDIAMRIGEQLKRDGRVRRGWLGVSLQEVTRDLAAVYGLAKPRGALVADMLPGGPAAKSELQIGDVILEYDGRPIDRSSELPPLVGLTAPGKRVDVKLYRHNQGTQAVTLLIGELKEEKAAAEPPVPVKTSAAANASARLGLALSESNPRQREKRDFGHGVNVEGVEEGVAREAGLRPGDVILEADRKRVHTVSEFNRLVMHAPKDRPVLLRIRRGAQALFLTLKVQP
jgi:serine protease Do